MLKKIVLGTLLVGLIGILVVGAVIRTLDKTGNVAEARGEGRGRGGSEDTGLLATEQGRGQGGGGYGRSAGSGALLATEQQVAVDWTEYEGTVVQAPAAGVDMVIKTEAGEEMVVGTAPSYLAEQGFSLEAGELVRVQGYWEDGEFKAAQLTRLRDGLTANLRDAYGRPAWSGSGQGNVSGDATGTGQAQVDEWLTLEGVATGADSTALVVTTAAGQEIILDGRAWRFLLEQGLQVNAGDELLLVGFYENDVFEAGEITDLSSGQHVLIRDENGRPLWAGRGRSGS